METDTDGGVGNGQPGRPLHPGIEAAEKLRICKGKLKLMQARPIGDACRREIGAVSSTDNIL